MRADKFLNYAEKYNFDVVPFEIKGTGANKTKRPTIAGWDKDQYIRLGGEFEHKLEQADHVAFIMKKDGIRMREGRYLVCLDIDDKQTGGEVAEDIYDRLLVLIGSKYGISRKDFRSISEISTSNGYHIFFTSDKLINNIQVKLERGAMIEVFTKARCIVTAPSDGYEVLAPKHDCIDFDTVCGLKIDKDELLNDILPAFGFESREVNNENSKYKFELNEEFVAESSKVASTEKSWKAFNIFMEGRSDKDWDLISEGYDKGSYNYVRYEIMPWMIVTGQTEKFLKKIENDFPFYYSAWSKYPARWEEVDPPSRPIGKVARNYLKKIGYILKNGKQLSYHDKQQQFLKEDLPELYNNSLAIEGGVYTYNDELNYYEFLGLEATRYKLITLFKNDHGYALGATQANNLADTVVQHLKSGATDPKVKWVKPYYLFSDRDYLFNIPLVFNNGTLYLTKDPKQTQFVEEFTPDDKVFFSFPCDYCPTLLEPELKPESVIKEWFEKKIPDVHALRFTQKYFGSLLVPAYTPQVALALYSAKGGTGKSTLADTLRRVLDPQSDDFNAISRVSTITASKFGEKNEGADLAHAIINISMETDRKINHEAMKVLISREVYNMSLKYVNSFDMRPLAKHLILGNKRPEYINDGGMARRMVVFELNDINVCPHMTGAQFGRAFEDDWKSLLQFMIGGIRILFEEGFGDMSREWMKSVVLEEHRVAQSTSTSTVSGYLFEQGYKEILKSANGLSKEELHVAYSSWMKTTNPYAQPVAIRNFQSSLSADEFLKTDARPRVEGKRMRMVQIHEEKKDRLLLLLEGLGVDF